MNGDWGLGIGDWAIPNPQSPIPNFLKQIKIVNITKLEINKYTINSLNKFYII